MTSNIFHVMPVNCDSYEQEHFTDSDSENDEIEHETNDVVEGPAACGDATAASRKRHRVSTHLFAWLKFDLTSIKYGMCEITRLQQIADMAATHARLCEGRVLITNITDSIDIKVRCKCDKSTCPYYLFAKEGDYEREHGKKRNQWHGSERKGRRRPELQKRLNVACLTTPNIVSRQSSNHL